MKRTSGFTLIELLVVIAVIAVLAALLYPVLARARERARATHCKNNLRQIGGALASYTQDWDETLPRSWLAGGPGMESPGGKYQNWKDMLFPYIGSKDVFLCPSNPVGWSPPAQFWGEGFIKGFVFSNYRLPGDETHRFPVSYSANVFVLRQGDEMSYPDSNNNHVYYSSQGRAVFLSEVTDPSSTIGIGETRFRTWWDCGPWFDQRAIDENGTLRPGSEHHHDKRINYLFMDGSVKSLKAIQTLLPRSLWGSPNLLADFEGYIFELPLNPMKPDDSLIQRIGEEYR